MKKTLCPILVFVLVILTGCAVTENQAAPEKAAGGYENISPADASLILKNEPTAVLLDVRTPEEHRQVRIPGSILLPYDEIKLFAAEVLPDKESVILIYCRSGRRSIIAAEALISLGYKNVKNLGGIIDWPYETISGE